MSVSEAVAINEHSSETAALCFGTKAETLARLKRVLRGASILDLQYFSVCDWRERKQDILDGKWQPSAIEKVEK